jgi:DeoD family purine-nucleoside phosphorylase
VVLALFPELECDVPDVPVCVVGFLTGVWLVLDAVVVEAVDVLAGGVVVLVVGVVVSAGGVVVLAGAFSGFLIGFGPAAATAGSASSTRASRRSGNARNRISAMIMHLTASGKGQGSATPRPGRVAGMPIHLRAEPGDYAEAVLLPGDPLRARHIAETFFDSPRQVNGERGMLGFTGTFEGAPISVQSSGMGCPSAAIVVEELIQLGVKRIVRVGTCGGLQTDMQLGDLILAISAVPSDATMLTYTGGEPHAPTADFELVHAAVHQAKHDGTKLRIGPCVSSSTFYDPDTGRAQRWSDRGVLGVEMEAAVLFTIAALRRIQAACLLTVSDIIVEGEFVRITDAELQAAVERMTELAIRTALSKAKH